jgi:hypothetical protein
MTALEALCATLALSTALLGIAVLVLAFRVLAWRERYEELIDKPFEFWRAREVARSIAAARWDQFDLMPPQPSAEIIELHLPPTQPPAA